MKNTLVVGRLILFFAVLCFWVFQDLAIPAQKHNSSIYEKVKPHDPEFVSKVLPVADRFFDALDIAEVNPVKGNPHYHSIRVDHVPNGMICKFLVGGNCGVTTYVGSGFAAMYLQTTDAPFGAISSGDTEELSRIAKSAIMMPKAEAERILKQVSDALGVDYSRLEKVSIYPEKMFDYDLGMWTAQYRRKGTPPIYQDYPVSFTIKATSPTTAVLVSYMNDGTTGK